MNNTVLTGRLVKDNELKFTNSSIAYVKNTIAVNNPFDKENPDFISITAWKKSAELMAEYTRKGSLIGIEGRINTGSYEKEGRKIYTTEVVVNRLEFLESKKQAEENKHQELPTGQAQPQASTSSDVDAFNDQANDVDGIPF